MDILTTILISLGTALAGSFSGWVFGRKRQSIENIDMARNTWQNIVDSLEKQIHALVSKVDTLSAENLELKEEVEALKNEILTRNSRAKENEVLKSKIKYYEKLLSDSGITY